MTLYNAPIIIRRSSF